MRWHRQDAANKRSKQPIDCERKASIIRQEVRVCVPRKNEGKCCRYAAVNHVDCFCMVFFALVAIPLLTIRVPMAGAFPPTLASFCIMAAPCGTTAGA